MIEGEVVELAGTMVDLTEVVHTDTQAEVSTAIAGVTKHRAVIEQAKGMLMLALGLHPDDAFDVLRAHSQNNNIKVHDLAERLTSTVLEETAAAPTLPRHGYCRSCPA